MQETIAPPAGDAEQIVLAHAQKNYSLAAADLKIKEVTPKDFFPGVQEFYVEESKGQHQTYNYLVYKNQAYSSGTDGDLSLFLKAYDFVKKTNEADEYLKLLRIFSLPKDQNVLDSEYLKNYQKEVQNMPQVGPPKLTKNSDGSAELIFFMTPVVPFRPEKWTAKFGSGGQIQISK